MIFRNLGKYWFPSNNPLYNYEGINDTSGLEWFEKGTWYNQGICGHMLGVSFEDYWKHGQKYRFDIICVVKAYDQDHQDKHDGESTDVSSPFKDKPTR